MSTKYITEIAGVEFVTNPEGLPKTPWFVKVHDNFLAGWGHGLPDTVWTLFACKTEAEADMVYFNCRYVRNDFGDIEMMRLGEPAYKLPRDEKALAARLEVYEHSIVAGFLADSLLSGSGVWEWMRWGEKMVHVIIPKKRWLTAGMNQEFTDENEIRFKFLTRDTGLVKAGQYYLDTQKVIDYDLPKLGRSYQRKEIWVVKKKRKEKWGTFNRPLVQIL